MNTSLHLFNSILLYETKTTSTKAHISHTQTKRKQKLGALLILRSLFAVVLSEKRGKLRGPRGDHFCRLLTVTSKTSRRLSTRMSQPLSEAQVFRRVSRVRVSSPPEWTRDMFMSPRVTSACKYRNEINTTGTLRDECLTLSVKTTQKRNGIIFTQIVYLRPRPSRKKCVRHFT